MITYGVVNPATGEQEKQYDLLPNHSIQPLLDNAYNAFKEWRKITVAQRADYLYKIVSLYEQRQRRLAEIMTKEMGKPIAQSLSEMEIVKDIFKYYADNSHTFLADEELTVQTGKATIVKEGLGVLFGIMPWNYPHYQVARFVAPNLINGNTIVLKHAPQCPETALAIQEMFLDAGLPEGVYTNVFVSNEQAAEIIAHDVIRGVSLTGSERAGSAVAKVAGQNIKKVVLELGGSDAFIVLPDADLEKAVEDAFIGRFANAGQACNAAKRIIVHRSIYQEFITLFTQKVAAITPENPMDESTFLGPVSSLSAAAGLQSQVDRAITEGATVLLPGGRIDRAGAWFAPVILTNVTPDMAIYHEEVFGPVAVIHKVDSESEAINLANDSDYGLGAVVYTQDNGNALAVAKKLDCGMVYVNAPPGSAADLPFGGIKKSGFGRELGHLAMDEFVNKKIISA